MTIHTTSEPSDPAFARFPGNAGINTLLFVSAQLMAGSLASGRLSLVDAQDLEKARKLSIDQARRLIKECNG